MGQETKKASFTNAKNPAGRKKSYSKNQFPCSYMTTWLIRSHKLYQYTIGKGPRFVLHTKLMGVESEKRAQFEILGPKFQSLSLTFIAINFCCVSLNLICLTRQYFHLYNQKMPIIQVMASFFSNIWVVTVLSVVYRFVHEVDLLKTVNRFLANELELGSLKPDRRDMQLGGIIPFYYFLGVFIFGTPFPLIIWFFDLQQFHTVLSDLIFGDPCYHNSTTTFTLHIFVLFILTIMVNMCLRELGVILLWVYNIIYCSLQHTRTLLAIQHKHDQEVFIRYLYLVSIYKHINILLERASLALIVFSQCILTLFVWFFIKCFKLFPNILLATFVLAFIGGLALSIDLYGLCAKLQKQSSKLIFQRMSHLKYSKHNMYWYLKWRSQKPVYINCGERFVIMEDTVMIHLNLLTSNIVNMVLLVKI